VQHLRRSAFLLAFGLAAALPAKAAAAQTGQTAPAATAALCITCTIGQLPIGLGNFNVGVTVQTPGGTTGPGGSTQTAATDPGPFAGVAMTNRLVRVSRSGVARIPVRCPSNAVGSCAGKLTLKSAGARAFGLGHASFRIAVGARATVRLHVSRKGRMLLRRAGRLRALASASSRDDRGQRKVTTAALTLSYPVRTRTTR
jgi:hypothetical protein